MKRSGLNTAMLMALIGGGLAGCSHNCYDRGQGCISGSGSGAVTINGKVVDGYVSGGTIFARKADGSCDTVSLGTTDASGNFSVSPQPQFGICASGGTDLSTGKPLVGVLKTPAGATMITPLTTMLAAAQAADPTLTPEAFAAKLGLAGVDLANVDPLNPPAGTPATLEQTGAAVQALLAAIATSMGGAANADALFGAAITGLVNTLAANPGIDLASVAASGDFSSIASSVATATQTAAASDPDVPATLKTAVASLSTADLNAAASAGSTAGADSAANNAPPAQSFTVLAGITANDIAGIATSGVVQTADSGLPDASLAISGKFNDVTITLADATGNAIANTGSTNTVISVAGSGVQNLSVTIPTMWAQDTATSMLTPTMTQGSVMHVSATNTAGSSVQDDISQANVAQQAIVGAASGKITLNLANLLSTLKTATSGTAEFGILAAYDGGNGTQAGKSYMITVTIPGLKLKSLESSQPTFNYTTKVTFK